MIPNKLQREARGFPENFDPIHDLWNNVYTLYQLHDILLQFAQFFGFLKSTILEKFSC